MMRTHILLLSTMALTLGSGCSLTSNGGLTARHESSQTYAYEASIPWQGEPIAVGNSEGSVRVVGVPGRTTVRIRAQFVVGANSDADADAAFADLASGLKVERVDGMLSVACPKAKTWHGSVDPASTGCSTFEVEVPAGTADVPVDLSVYAGFGGIHVSALTVSKLLASAPFGIVADVVPSHASNIQLQGQSLMTGMCSTILRIPEATTFGQATLTVENPELKYVGISDDDPNYMLGTVIEGFPDAPTIAPRTGTTGWARGRAPFDVSTIELHASLGKAILTTAPVPAYNPANQCLNFELRVNIK